MNKLQYEYCTPTKKSFGIFIKQQQLVTSFMTLKFKNEILRHDLTKNIRSI